MSNDKRAVIQFVSEYRALCRWYGVSFVGQGGEYPTRVKRLDDYDTDTAGQSLDETLLQAERSF